MPVKKMMANMPFAGNVADSLELMRRVWGATGMPSPTGMAQFAAGLPQALPSMITPTLDVAELDKRIADLRAVEHWLALNTQMLRTTIQTLEVQRNTIATLKSLGGAVLSSLPGGGGPRPGSKALPPQTNRARRARIEPFKVQPGPQPTAAPAAPHARQPARPATSASAGPADVPLNPTLWWNALQDQFARVAASATAAASTGAPAPKPRSAGKPAGARKPARRAATG